MTGRDEDVSRLAEVIGEKKETILSRWEARARELLHMDDLPRGSLRDHMPRVLEDVRALLVDPGSPAVQGIEGHALDRLGRGFDVSLVVEECDLLRLCVVDAWNEAIGGTAHPMAPCEALHDAFDRLVVQTLARHGTEEEQTRASLDIGLHAALGAELDAVLPRIADTALRAIDRAESVAFYVRTGSRLVLSAHAALHPDLTPDEVLAERAAAALGPVSERRGEGRACARVALPMVQNGDLLGVAQMTSRSVDEFSEFERLVLRALANHVEASVLQSRHAGAEREAERKLSQTHAVLSALYDNAPIGLGYLDDELRYLHANAALAAFNGKSVDEHVGRTVSEVVPEVAPVVEPVLREVLAPGGGERELEVTAATPARPGELRHWIVNAYPVVDPQTHRGGVGVIVRDVTAQKRAQETLESRARQQAELSAFGIRALRARELQAIFDDAVETVSRTLGTELAKVLELTADRQELILRAGVGWKDGLVGRATVSAGSGSQAGFTLLSREPVIVSDLRAERRFCGPPLLLEHGVVSGMSVVIEALGPHEQPYGVLGTHTRERREFSAEDAAFLQSVANVVGASVLRSRVEARAEFEQRRGDAQQFLSDAGSILVSTLDYDETLTKIAQLCVRALADCCVIDLASDTEVRKLRVVHRDPEKASLSEALQGLRLDPERPHLSYAAARSRRPVLIPNLSPEQLETMAQSEAHLRLMRELRPVSLMALPLKAHGRMLGALVLLSCSDDRRFGQEDLQLAKELSHRVALALAGARLYANAQRAIFAREEVLAVVAHDLRNPIGAISLTAGALLRQIPEDVGHRSERAIERIQRAATRANRLIQDLLDVASIDAGKLRLERVPLRPDAVVAEALETIAPAASEARLTLERCAPAGLPPVLADRDRLLQVLSNLLGNALKFTPAGGHVAVRAARQGGELVFSVADTGPGLSPEQLPRLFDRFWQDRPASRRGVGLGLSIAKGIVEAHGGRIWAESTQGRGSTFYFTVPVSLGQLGTGEPEKAAG